jgi:hypothetical protein
MKISSEIIVNFLTRQWRIPKVQACSRLNLTFFQSQDLNMGPQVVIMAILIHIFQMKRF